MTDVLDHCTAWIEGWWAAACAAHDAAYAAGDPRAIADAALFFAVAASLPDWAAAHPALAGVATGISIGMAAVMWAGVRLFGARFWRRRQ